MYCIDHFTRKEINAILAIIFNYLLIRIEEIIDGHTVFLFFLTQQNSKCNYSF